MTATVNPQLERRVLRRAWPLIAGAATAAAGKALGKAAGLLDADGNGIDLFALERGEASSAPRRPGA